MSQKHVGLPIHGPNEKMPEMSERQYSGQVERVLRDADEIAASRGHAFIGTEHLLLALTRTDDGSFARRLLDDLAVTDAMRQRIEDVIGSDPAGD